MAAFWVLKDSLLFLITKEEKNLRDLFPEPPSSKDVPNCSFNGVLGTLPGMMGTMMAHETLKLIIGLPTLKNELVLFKTLKEFHKAYF
jgi:adenylyltransferase/sulfurtransferase